MSKTLRFLENQSFKQSVVNFSSMLNISAKAVFFSLLKTEKAASSSCFKVALSKFSRSLKNYFLKPQSGKVK